MGYGPTMAPGPRCPACDGGRTGRAAGRGAAFRGPMAEVPEDFGGGGASAMGWVDMVVSWNRGTTKSSI